MRYHAARTGITSVTAALLLALPLPAQTSDASYSLQSEDAEPTLGPEGTPRDPAETGAAYARLLYYEGGISLRRAADMDLPAAEVNVNAPLVPGDEIWTGDDGRAEIQLADGSLLRLGASARLNLMNLADYAGALDETTLLRLPNGSLYVRAADFDAQSRRFQIDTPSGSIFLLSQGTFRIDVTTSGVTTVSSYRGVAELLGEENSVIAHSGERMTASPGRLPSQARAFNTLHRDEFDVWAETRDDAISSARSGRAPAPESLPSPVRPYATELSYYGTWQDTPEYGLVWVPSGVSDDWRPYYYGRWSWAPIGMVWVSSEPWGYAPYHYGRWHWAVGTGWFWAPGYIYSGAYVSWAAGPYYYGWCPTGFYGYPVVYAGYGHSYYHGWSYVHHSHVYHHDVHDYYYSYSDVVRHRMKEKSSEMDDAPDAHPRSRPERVGADTYRHAQARQSSRPRRIDPPAQNASFRERDVREFRRRAAQRGPETAQGNGAGPADRSRPARTSPGSLRPAEGPRAGSPNRVVAPTQGVRTQDRIASRARGSAAGRQQVSPVSGRTIAPTGRVAPGRAVTRAPGEGATSSPAARIQPAVKAPSRVEPGRAAQQSVGRSTNAPPPARERSGMAPRRAAPAQSRVQPAQPSAPARQPLTRSGVVQTRPHAQVAPGGRPAGRSPFVMVDRGRGSAGAQGGRPTAVSARPTGKAPAARPAQQSGKGGKASGGRKK